MFPQQPRQTQEAMASRRSPAAFHSIMLSYTRVLQGWWYIVYVALSAPCPEGTRIHQKPTASSEGAQLWDIRSPSLGSAKRDRLPSSTSSGMRQSPFGELYLGGGVALTHSCAASQLAVGFMIQVTLRGTSSSYSICLHLWVRGYGETPQPPGFVLQAHILQESRITRTD